jgi:ATP-binding cassette subfamily F protein uup
MNRPNAVEAEVARIESLFADPEFFRKHATQVNQLTTDLDAAKENVTQLYARWEQLEAIRAASNCSRQTSFARLRIGLSINPQPP